MGARSQRSRWHRNRCEMRWHLRPAGSNWFEGDRFFDRVTDLQALARGVDNRTHTVDGLAAHGAAEGPSAGTWPRLQNPEPGGNRTVLLLVHDFDVANPRLADGQHRQRLAADLDLSGEIHPNRERGFPGLDCPVSSQGSPSHLALDAWFHSGPAAPARGASQQLGTAADAVRALRVDLVHRPAIQLENVVGNRHLRRARHLLAGLPDSGRNTPTPYTASSAPAGPRRRVP